MLVVGLVRARARNVEPSRPLEPVGHRVLGGRVRILPEVVGPRPGLVVVEPYRGVQAERVLRGPFPCELILRMVCARPRVVLVVVACHGHGEQRLRCVALLWALPTSRTIPIIQTDQDLGHLINVADES